MSQLSFPWLWRALVIMLACGCAVARAGALDQVSSADATQAVRQALAQGADKAVAQLGRPGGFLDDPQLRIPLPDTLRKSRRVLELMGRGKELDALETSINRAAEQAVPQGKAVLERAVRSMTLADAKQILTGGDDSVTRFFRENTRDDLLAKLQPLVDKEIAELGIARQYDALAGKGAQLGLLEGPQSSLSGYVTDRALEGLFTVIAREERALRQDPLAAGSRILRQVFGALR